MNEEESFSHDKWIILVSQLALEKTRPEKWARQFCFSSSPRCLICKPVSLHDLLKAFLQCLLKYACHSLNHRQLTAVGCTAEVDKSAELAMAIHSVQLLLYFVSSFCYLEFCQAEQIFNCWAASQIGHKNAGCCCHVNLKWGFVSCLSIDIIHVKCDRYQSIIRTILRPRSLEDWAGVKKTHFIRPW